MADEFMNVFNDTEVKALAKFEQKLPDVRAIYERLSVSERKEMVEWLTALDALCGEDKLRWSMTALIQTHVETTTEDGPVFDSVELTPHVMLEAIQTWEKGEQFSPSGIFGTF